MAARYDPDDLRQLFPEEEAQELVDVIGNSVAEVSEFQSDVHAHITLIRAMLDDLGDLDRVAAVWHEQAVERIGAAQILVDAAASLLAPNWYGSAYRAYLDYHDEVMASMVDTEDRAREAASAIREVRDTVALQYQEAVESLTTFIAGVSGLAGGEGRVRQSGAGQAIGLVRTFVEEVGTCMRLVVGALGARAEAVSRFRAAATPAPMPVALAAPEIGQPQRWELRPGAGAG